jgi:hypothetical protein
MSEPEFRIVQCDALALLKEQPTASVDALITDGPYSSGGATRGDRVVGPAAKSIAGPLASSLRCSARRNEPRTRAVLQRMTDPHRQRPHCITSDRAALASLPVFIGAPGAPTRTVIRSLVRRRLATCTRSDNGLTEFVEITAKGEILRGET